MTEFHLTELESICILARSSAHAQAHEHLSSVDLGQRKKTKYMGSLKEGPAKL